MTGIIKCRCGHPLVQHGTHSGHAPNCPEYFLWEAERAWRNRPELMAAILQRFFYHQFDAAGCCSFCRKHTTSPEVGGNQICYDRLVYAGQALETAERVLFIPIEELPDDSFGTLCKLAVQFRAVNGPMITCPTCVPNPAWRDLPPLDPNKVCPNCFGRKEVPANKPILPEGIRIVG